VSWALVDFVVVVGWGGGTETAHRLFDRLTVGRAPESDIVITGDERVSRAHAVLVMGRRGVRVEDLGSRTGTRVNGKPVRSAALSDGDVVAVGGTALRVRVVQARGSGLEAAATEASPWAFAERPAPSAESAALRDVGTQFRSYAIVREVVRALQGATETGEVLRAVADAVFRVSGADRVHLVLVDEGSGELLPALARHRNPEIGAIRVSLSRSILDEAIRSRRAVFSNDATSDERFAAGASVMEFAIRSVLCAPIIAGDEALGAVQLDRVTPGARFGAADAELLEVLGALLGVRLDAMRWRERALRAEAARSRTA
jgi:sigma-B regulation protein RsbU (phosphoserine phosphatase)